VSATFANKPLIIVQAVVLTEKLVRLVFTLKITYAGKNVLPAFTEHLATLASLVNTPAQSVIWQQTFALVAAKIFQGLWQIL